MNLELYPCRHCQLVHLSELFRTTCERGCAPVESSDMPSEYAVLLAFLAMIGLTLTLFVGLLMEVWR